MPHGKPEGIGVPRAPSAALRRPPLWNPLIQSCEAGLHHMARDLEESSRPSSGWLIFPVRSRGCHGTPEKRSQTAPGEDLEVPTSHTRHGRCLSSGCCNSTTACVLNSTRVGFKVLGAGKPRMQTLVHLCLGRARFLALDGLLLSVLTC